MDCLFGITYRDGVLIAADTTAARSIVVMKSNDDKQRILSKHVLMAYAGEPGDCVQFAEYVQRNIRLYGIRNAVDLTPSAAASFTRQALAKALRSRNPYSTNLLLGGFDITTGRPSLYWIDYLAAQAEVPFAAQGYGAFFCLSTMDRYHSPDMSQEEAVELMRRCLNELKTRFIINLPNFMVRVVDRQGIREIPVQV